MIAIFISLYGLTNKVKKKHYLTSAYIQFLIIINSMYNNQ